MNHFGILPARTRHMLQYMIKDDWLSSYAHIEGIGMALRGMSRRTTFESNLENAEDELKADYDFYRQRFNVFFPEIILFAEEYLKTNK